MKLLLTFLFVAFCLSSKPPVSGHSLHDAEVKEKEEEHMDLDDSSFFGM